MRKKLIVIIISSKKLFRIVTIMNLIDKLNLGLYILLKMLQNVKKEKND